MSRQQSSRRGCEAVALSDLRWRVAGFRIPIIWLLSHTKTMLLFLLPSFIQDIFTGTESKGELLTSPRDSSAPTEKNQDHRHAHLDGLRGFAALSVFVLHLFSPFDLTLGSGYGPDPWTRTLFNLPVIRLIHSGQAMVKVFFVISGFSLTVKPAEYILSPPCAMSSAQLHQHLAMSILKRAIRLFLPPLVTTFCAMCLAYAGAFMTMKEIMGLPTGFVYLGIVRRQTFSLQLLDWAKFVACKLTNPWVWLDGGWRLGQKENMEDFSIYGPHLWTIQTEFRCSMVLFLVFVAVSRIPQRRLQELLSLSIVVYCATWGRWDVALFISGMLCCLVSARQHASPAGEEIPYNNSLPTEIEASPVSSPHAGRNTELEIDSYEFEAPSQDCYHGSVNSVHLLNSSWWERRQRPLRIRTSPRQRWFLRLPSSLPTTLNGNILTFLARHLLYLTALAASLWLLSFPERVRPGTLGFEILRRISPDPDLWQSIGAVLLVFVVGKMSSIRYIVMSSIAQYLGKISFAFYLVHVPVLESVGWRIANTWRVAAEALGNGKDVGKTTVFFSSAILSVAAHVFMFAYVFLIVIYFADLAWMYVDKPTILLLRIFQSAMMRQVG